MGILAAAAAALAFTASAAAAPCLDAKVLSPTVTVSAIVYQDTWTKPAKCKPGYCGALLHDVNWSDWEANRPPSRLPPCTPSVIRDVGVPSFEPWT